MKKIELNNNKYELIKNDNGCFNIEEVNEKIKDIDYFDDYDYIFGDYSYGKVRFKGFYDSNNEKTKKINDIKYIEDYKKYYCSYGSKTFLLKKVK